MLNKNLVLFFLTFSFALCTSAANDSYKIAVRSFKVEPFELYDSFTAVGQAKFKQSRTYYANVEGRVAHILKNNSNFNVSAGEIILTIDPEVATSLKKQKEQALAVAEFFHDKNQKLFERKFISEEALENSKSKLADVKADLAKSLNIYNDMIITAPFAGNVGVIALRIGDNVKKGDYLFSLIDKKEINIFLELPESLHGRVNNNTCAIITDTQGVSAKGIVLAATPYVSDKGTMSVEISVSGENKFLHGSYLNVELIMDKHKSLAIPESAVLKNDKGNFIYKIEEDNTVRQLYVKLGMRNSNMIEVLSDTIKEGDRIVLEGLTKVQEGATVEVID